MKILFVGRWRTERMGGPDVVIREYARELLSLGHEVTVWSPNRKVKVVSEPRFEDGVEVIDLPIFEKLPVLKKAAKEFIISNRGKFDKALYFSVFSPLNILVARVLQCPYAVVPLGGYARGSIYYRGTLRKKAFLALCERAFLENALFINVWSSNEQKDISLIASARRYVITPPGFKQVSLPVRQPHGEKPGRRILFIGRFAILAKGLDRLIDAFTNAAGPHDELTIAGADFRGGLAALESRRAASPAKDRIRIVGPAWGEEKTRLLQTHDLFVHLSRWEGLPLALVEAMAVGMPVIISEETNTGEYVRNYDAGWVVKANDFDSTLRKALSSSGSELDRRGANAAQLVANEFRWDNAGRTIEQALLQPSEVPKRGEIDGNAATSTAQSRSNARPRLSVLVIGRWRPESANGVDRTIVSLARSFVGLGHSVTIWQPTRNRRCIVQETPERGINLVHLPIGPLGLSLPAESRKFIKKEQTDFDIAHFHSVFTPSNCCIARFLNIPYTVTPHGGYSPASIRNRGFIKKHFFLGLYERRFLEAAAFIHVLSERERSDVSLLCRQKSFLIAPNGHTLEEGIPPTLSNAGKRDRKIIRFLFLGRLSLAHKGLDRMLKSFSLVKNKNFSLTIAGPDFRGGRTKLERMARELGLESQISFMEPVFGKEKWQLVAESDISVHLSRWEGMPFSILEAMGASKPVLLTPETNLADYVSRANAGWVASSAHPEHAIEKCLNASESELLEKGGNARRLIEHDFSWSKIAAKMLAEYERHC